MPQTPENFFASHAHKPYSLWLDSADTNHPDAQNSLIFTDPAITIESKNGHVTISGEPIGNANPFDVLQDQMQKHPGLTAAGLFGYDLGRELENLPGTAKDTSSLPDMAVGLYETVYRHPGVSRDLVALNLRDPGFRRDDGIEWTPSLSPQTFKSNIQRVIDYIHAGDIFQANLAQRFDAELPPGFDPFEHYLHLRQINPAPFAAYFNLGETQIASCSPERFLTVQDGHVETKPIKGTLPRARDPQILINSEKDRAENIMIVDLLRNDLSKVCKAESITVEKLCALESFSSVHHLVSTITGKLQTGKTPIDLLKAAFPGGSITGAPKIRAMEIIEELEGSRRGPYTGCIGYITPDGHMDTNILIRTLVYEKGKVSLSVGGGITAQSNPEDEYQETLDKAARIFESFSSPSLRAVENREAIQSHKAPLLDCFVAGGSSQ